MSLRPALRGTITLLATPRTAPPPFPLAKFTTKPWFMEDAIDGLPPASANRNVETQQQPHVSGTKLTRPTPSSGTPGIRSLSEDVCRKPIPLGVPGILRTLHKDLSVLPHLDQSVLEICKPIESSVGPPLPHALPQGRRRRGRTDYGMGVPETSGGLWKWIVLAQVIFLRVFLRPSSHGHGTKS